MRTRPTRIRVGSGGRPVWAALALICGLATPPAAHALDLLIPLHPSSALSTSAGPQIDLATLFALWVPRQQPAEMALAGTPLQ